MDTAAATGGRGLVPVGFAIPIGRARAVAGQMRRGRGSATVILARRGFLGVEVVNSRALAPTQATHLGTRAGAVVVAVIPHTPAAQAALAPRDVLVAVNGQTVANIQQLGTDIADHRPGAPLRITWITPTGQRKSATVLLTSAPMA
jgi:S1-C subfamily serine protease